MKELGVRQTLLGGSFPDDASDIDSTPKRVSWTWPVLLSFAINILTFFCLITTAIYFSLTWRTTLDSRCLQHVNRPSPLIPDVPISFDPRRFNGTFMNENIYRQAASKEVDEAWEALGVNYRPLAVPEENAEQFGLTRNHIHIQNKYGGGFPANVEALHHLHCLNLLRQSLYYNYDYYKNAGKGAFVNEDRIVRRHVSHCLDILRQQLTCTADVGVMGQVWYRLPGETEVHGFVDFHTVHTCRSNYEGIRQWAEERQLPVETPPDFLVQPGPGVRVHEGVP